ncbi:MULTISPECIES: hypothetical protein [Prauserella salsuginis group]|uniref:PH (Pleckstrin Homology) domain-containing protein n=1 Tax=Prauserella salsuginis TaxID=387889 RepID=A0ABW6G569_9PSEU|nr:MULTISPECIES: hypothetical protein [Prauserella salsuginis group]
MTTPERRPARRAPDGSGWRTRANLVVPVLLSLFGLAMVVCAALPVIGAPPGARVLLAGFGAVLLLLAWPNGRRGRRAPYPTIHDGVAATAVPRRGIRLSSAMATLVLGVTLVVAAVGSWRVDGEAEPVMAVLGGLVTLAGAATAFHPRARRPAPLLVTAQGLAVPDVDGYGETPWPDVASIDRGWTFVGRRWTFPRHYRNHIAVTGRDGACLALLPIERFAGDPAAVLALLRSHHAEHASEAT